MSADHFLGRSVQQWERQARDRGTDSQTASCRHEQMASSDPIGPCLMFLTPNKANLAVVELLNERLLRIRDCLCLFKLSQRRLNLQCAKKSMSAFTCISCWTSDPSGPITRYLSVPVSAQLLDQVILSMMLWIKIIGPKKLLNPTSIP